MIRLQDVATAASCRVGDDATLDVSLLADEDYGWLLGELTEERLHHAFAELQMEQIRRFELSNIATLHFVLYDAFLRADRHWLLDEHGKLLAGRLLEIELPPRE
jgi:hypothetical protein